MKGGNYMEKIKNYFINNYLKIILIFIILLLFIAEFLFMNYIVNTKINKVKETNNKVSFSMELEEDKKEIEEYIYIDIKGSVKKPNVYKLLKGSRVNDAIKEAGGLSKNANTRFINLSKVLNDSDVIVIYSNDEIKKANKANTIYVNTPCVCEEVKNDACIKNEEISNDSNKLININTATIDELMTLNGIGESKAKAIIEYRTNNGNFTKIEDITLVNGISETIYAKIKNNITI